MDPAMDTRFSLKICAVAMTIAAAGCGGAKHSTVVSNPTISLQSPVLVSGYVIPARYKCDAARVWLPLRWSAVPAKTEELVVLITSSNWPNSTETIAASLIIGLKPTTHSLSTGNLPHHVLAEVSGSLPGCPSY